MILIDGGGSGGNMQNENVRKKSTFKINDSDISNSCKTIFKMLLKPWVSQRLLLFFIFL